MRERLGMLVIEDVAGKVSIQLFSDIEKALSMYRDLRGKPGDEVSRATFLTLSWPSGCEMESRELPVLTDKSNEPDGWRVGVGPITFEKET